MKLFLVFVVILWLAITLFLLSLYLFNITPSYTTLIIAAIIGLTATSIIGYQYTTIFSRDIIKFEQFIYRLHNKDKENLPPPGFTSKTFNDLARIIYDDRNKAEKFINEHIEAEQKSIEKQKEILLSKQILANNLNHEIKTPIGIIQGYIDTLIEHDEDIPAEMRKRFLNKCLDNALRLQNMAFNLSVISRLDNGKDAIIMDNIDLVETLNSVADDLSPMFEKVGITFHNLLPKTLIVHSNTTLLYNIFSNLSKNAVFYSGGTDIFVELTPDNGISFRDNGKGVDEEALPNIFNRFYRIDKDRNRNLSSSGLGLSIVRESVKMHGNDIIAKNHPEGGLQFIFKL